MKKSNLEVSEELLRAIFSSKAFFELGRSVMYSAGLSTSSKFFYITKEFDSNVIGIPIAQTHLNVYNFYEFDGESFGQCERNNSKLARSKIIQNSYPLIIYLANPIYAKPLPQMDLEEEVLRNDLFELYETSLIWKIRKGKTVFPILTISQPIDKNIDEFQLLLLQQKNIFNEDEIKKIFREYLMLEEGIINFPLTPYEYSNFLDFFKRNYTCSVFKYSTKADSFRDIHLYYECAQKSFGLTEMITFESLESSLDLKNFIF
jgi:hypothetical protein